MTLERVFEYFNHGCASLHHIAGNDLPSSASTTEGRTDPLVETGHRRSIRTWPLGAQRQGRRYRGVRAALIRQYERQIFRTAQHITQNREDAEDITQDVFFKAYQKLEQFQGNSKFSTWLVRIAVNESLMRLRKRKTSKTVSMDQDVETDEGSIPRDFAEWRPNPEQNSLAGRDG